MPNRQSGPRRKTAWYDTLVDVSVANAAQVGLDLTSDLSAPDRIGCTATRVILELWADLTVTNTTDAVQVIDIGIGVMSGEAAAASVLPDPDEATDAPAVGWLYRGRSICRLEASKNFYRPGSFKVDIRSQRILGPRVELTLVVDNNSTEGTPATVVLRGLIRTLCKLP